MTNKDLLKILLCSYGYDRNIKIETYRGDGGFIGYDTYAENKEGDQYHEVSCEDFMFQVYVLLDFMKSEEAPFKSSWWSVPIKYVCDESERNSLIDGWDKHGEHNKKWSIAYKPIEEWHKQNNPCPTCTINKKDHWDDIHYNCELNHTHQCKIMIAHYDKKTEMMRSIVIPE